MVNSTVFRGYYDSAMARWRDGAMVAVGSASGNSQTFFGLAVPA